MTELNLEKFKPYKIDKSISYPLYHQFKDIILEMLEKDELRPGEMIPTELDLCTVFDISRTTIRQAFNELVDSGKFIRVKGRGTFVSQDLLKHQSFDFVRSFVKSMDAQHHEASLVLHSKIYTKPSEDICQLLKMSPNHYVIHYAYSLLADNLPICYVDSYFPNNAFADLIDMEIDLLSSNPRNLHTESVQTRVYRTESRFLAELPTKFETDYFDINKTVAILKYEFFAHNRFDQPIEYTVAKFRGDINLFSFTTFYDNALGKK